MLNLILATIGRIIDLLSIRETRIRLRFKLVYSPSFSELEHIHSDYLSVFEQVRSTLESATEATPDAMRSALLGAARTVRERRAAWRPQRQKLLMLANTLPKAASGMKPTESGFIKAFIEYFGFANYLIETVGDFSKRSPREHLSAGSALESRLWSLRGKLRRLEAAYAEQSTGSNTVPVIEYAVDDVDELIKAAEENWRTVAAAFQTLQLDVIAHATKDI